VGARIVDLEAFVAGRRVRFRGDGVTDDESDRDGFA
jgi:hypothetical protein